MRTKTSITIPEELVIEIDRYGAEYKNRSVFIEQAIRGYIKQIARQSQNKRDLEIINRNAERLNSETDDVLSYQVNP